MHEPAPLNDRSRRPRRLAAARGALAVALALVAAGLGALIHARGFDGAFQAWGVPGYRVPFLDWAMLTGSVQTYAQGIDPHIQNPGDPLGRVFNYPRIWFIFFGLPLSHQQDVAAGIIIVLLFLAAAVLFPRKASALSETLLFFGLISPAAMLGYDRANVDLLIFALMALSLALVDRWALAALATLLIATFFKLIPILGLGLFLEKSRGSAIRLVSAALLGAGLYFLFTFQDLLFIFSHTQKGSEAAYGVQVLPDLLGKLAGLSRIHRSPLFSALVHMLNGFLLHFPYVPYALAFLLLLLAGFTGFRCGGRPEAADAHNLGAFWMGAGVYIGTFLIGNNWDYRLVFLLFTLPQLGDWARSKRQPVAPISILTLVLLFGSLYGLLVSKYMADFYTFGAYYAAMLDEAVNWALFTGLAYLLASSLPAWVSTDAGRFAAWFRRFGKSTGMRRGAASGA